MKGLMPFERGNREIANLHNMIDDFFDDFWVGNRSSSMGNFKMDVREEEEKYIVEAELPGIEKEDIKLEFDDGMLRIIAEKEEKIEEENENYIHKEIRKGFMERSIYLVNSTEVGIKAKLKKGVLKIEIPKVKDKENRKRIEIE